jgi:hypothetical protein
MVVGKHVFDSLQCDDFHIVRGTTQLDCTLRNGDILIFTKILLELCDVHGGRHDHHLHPIGLAQNPILQDPKQNLCFHALLVGFVDNYDAEAMS